MGEDVESPEFELDRLRRVVEATAEAMGSASPRAMQQPPFRRFGLQYNRIRAEALRLIPQLAGLIPPRVPTGRKTADGDAPIDARYLEVRCYLVQLGVLLTPAQEAPP